MLTGQGWKRKGQRLVLEPLNLSDSLDGETGGWLSQVQSAGSDAVCGQPQTDLSLAQYRGRPERGAVAGTNPASRRDRIQMIDTADLLALQSTI